MISFALAKKCANKPRAIFILCCYIFCSSGLSSCRYDDSSEAICDCRGQISKFDGSGIVALAADNTYVIVSDKLGIGLNCNSLPDSLKIDGLKVSFFGKMVIPCKVFHNDLTLSRYEVIEMKRDNSIFKSGTSLIEIIHSQDYGYPVGFGFSLLYEDYNFSIIQKTIPGSNNIPFKTENDAFKCAVLLASKLGGSTDFPKIPAEELHYLQIQF